MNTSAIILYVLKLSIHKKLNAFAAAIYILPKIMR